MHILEINTESGWRGGERQTFYQLLSLRDAGLRVELLCRRGGSLARKAARAGIPVYQVCSEIGAMVFLALYGRRYDLLHAQTGRAQSFAVLTKTFHRRPVLYTRRVDFVPRGSFTRWKYRHTDRIVAISRAIRDILIHNGFEVAAVIPSMVFPPDPDRLRAEALKEQVGLKGRKVIATIGALVPHKDPLTMVRAIAELDGKRDDFIFLHFGDGPLRKRAEKLAGSLGLAGNYRFLGHLPKVEDFYPLFDLYVMSSREEGLGSSVLDAFAHGVPVVSTDAGGLRELVEGRGRLSPAGEHLHLAGEIDRVLSDDSLRERMIAAGLAAAAEYSPGKMTARYLEIMKTLPGW